MASTSLWMGDVGSHWDDAYIAAFFAHLPGFVRVKLMTRSGYGFVDFDSQEAAGAALALMAGKPTGQYGTVFRLNWAGKGKGADALGLAHARTPYVATDFTVYVAWGTPTGYVPLVTEAHLRAVFGRYPSLLTVRSVQDPVTGHAKGYGFVRFGALEDVHACLHECDGLVLANGARLHVAPAQGPVSQPIHVGSYAGVDAGEHARFPPSSAPLPYAAPHAHMSATQARGAMPTPAPLPPAVYTPPNPMAMSGVPPGARPVFGPPPHPSEGQTTIFVGGLDAAVTEYDLFMTFSSVGVVANVKVPKDKSCGFVQYSYRVHAEQALLSLQGLQLGTTHIRLAWGKNQLGSRSPIAVMPPTNAHVLMPPRAPVFPRGAPHADAHPYTHAEPGYYGHPGQSAPRGFPSASHSYHTLPTSAGLDAAHVAPPYPSMHDGHPDDIPTYVMSEFTSPTDTLLGSMAGLKLDAGHDDATAAAPTLAEYSHLLGPIATTLGMGATGADALPTLSTRSASTARTEYSSDPLAAADAAAYNSSWSSIHMGLPMPMHIASRFPTFAGPALTASASASQGFVTSSSS